MSSAPVINQRQLEPPCKRARGNVLVRRILRRRFRDAVGVPPLVAACAPVGAIPLSKRKKLLNLDDAEASRDLALILAEIRDAQDTIVLLVRGEIILDNLMNQLLERYLHFSDSAEGFDRRYKLFFAGKCELAVAVGLLSKSERDILLDFNRFRNRAAHRIDVHVHEKEVAALVKQLAQYGWSPISPEKDGAPLSLIDTLRDIVLSLVGLLIERIARTLSAGKLGMIGYELDQSHWKKLGAFGTILAVMTIARERAIRAQETTLHDELKKRVESILTDKSVAALSDGELTAEINRRLEESPPPSFSEITETVLKEIQPLADRFGGRMTVRYKPSITVTAKISRQDDHQTS